MHTTARLITPLALAVVATLVGCAPSAPGPTPTTSITSTPSASDAQPTPSPTSTPSAGAEPGAIEGFAVGDSWADVTAGIPGFATVEGCGWLGITPDGGFDLSVLRESGSSEADPVTMVQVAVPPEDAEPIGPQTAEGIGIGSTLDDALAAYPDAEQIDGPGPTDYLRVGSTGDGASSLFLTYSNGEDVVWAVTATSLPQPPYEPCA